MLKKYREAINPPYSRKDLPLILGTVFLLVTTSLAVLITFNSTDSRSRAVSQQEITALEAPVTASFSDLVYIISPQPNSTINLNSTVLISVDPSVKVKHVEFWKDNDKSPFAIVYLPTDESQNNVYEAALTPLRPGKHTLHTNVVTADENVLMSDNTTFFTE